MNTYRQILKRAFEIAWKKPKLWLLGLLVILLGGASEMEFIFGNYIFGSKGAVAVFFQGLADGGLFTVAGARGLVEALFTNTFYLFIIAFIFLVVLGLTALIVWLVMVSQSALIGKVVSINQGREISGAQGWKLGMIKFWPVLGLNALLRLLAWFLSVVLGFLAFLKFPGSIVFFIFGFDIFLIIILIFSFVTKYAICGVVLKNWSFGQSIKSAWNLFVKNWLLSLEVAVILFFIYLFADAILVFLISLVLMLALKLYGGFLFGSFLTFVFLMMVFVLVQVLLTIFYWATWIIVFDLLTSSQPTLVSRLKIGFKKLTGR